MQFLENPHNCSSKCWLQTIVLNKPNEDLRNDILNALNAADWMRRPAWTGLHKLDHFKACPKMEMNITNPMEKRIINISSSSFLSE